MIKKQDLFIDIHKKKSALQMEKNIFPTNEVQRKHLQKKK